MTAQPKKIRPMTVFAVIMACFLLACFVLLIKLRYDAQKMEQQCAQAEQQIADLKEEVDEIKYYAQKYADGALTEEELRSILRKYGYAQPGDVYYK